MRGTHSGAWMGIGLTGLKVSIPMITIHRIADGKIAEDWVLVGSLMLFQQLGLVPQTQEIFGAAKSKDFSHEGMRGVVAAVSAARVTSAVVAGFGFQVCHS
jgi:hypothetical protein